MAAKPKMTMIEPPTENVIDDGFLPVSEAAKFLGVSRSKLYMMMDSGQLVFAKFGKSRRVPRRGLFEYAERCLVGA